jgi:hypothetical protein
LKTDQIPQTTPNITGIAANTQINPFLKGAELRFNPLLLLMLSVPDNVVEVSEPEIEDVAEKSRGLKFGVRSKVGLSKYVGQTHGRSGPKVVVPMDDVDVDAKV